MRSRAAAITATLLFLLALPVMPVHANSAQYTLEWEGYDYDAKEEVTVALNERVVTNLPTTWASENNDSWVKFTLDVTQYAVSGNDTLSFTQNSGSSKVRNLSIAASDGSVIFSDPTERATWIGTTSSKPSITYTFEVPGSSTTTLATLDSGLTRGVPVSSTASHSSNSKVFVRDSANTSKRLWVIDPDPWAVRSADGSVSISYTGQGNVGIRNTLRNIDGDFGMGGVAKILYGRDPWGNLAAGQPPVFPIQLKEMDALTADVSYTLSYSQMGGNIYYNLFLTNVPDTTDNSGAIEVMVWLWKRNMVTGVEREVTPESITIPMKFNGVTIQSEFHFYLDPAPEHGLGGRAWFLLDDAQKISSGDVELNLLSFVKHTLQRLAESHDLYLQGVEFGTEYTDADQDYTFTLTRFHIEQNLASTAPTDSPSPPLDSTLAYTLEWECYDCEYANSHFVNMNGDAVGSVPAMDTSSNNDAWVPFSLDVSSFVRSGSNTLTIKENSGTYSEVRNVVIRDSNGTVVFSAPSTVVLEGWIDGNESVTYGFTV